MRRLLFEHRTPFGNSQGRARIQLYTTQGLVLLQKSVVGVRKAFLCFCSYQAFYLSNLLLLIRASDGGRKALDQNLDRSDRGLTVPLART